MFRRLLERRFIRLKQDITLSDGTISTCKELLAEVPEIPNIHPSIFGDIDEDEEYNDYTVMITWRRQRSTLTVYVHETKIIVELINVDVTPQQESYHAIELTWPEQKQYCLCMIKLWGYA